MAQLTAGFTGAIEDPDTTKARLRKAGDAVGREAGAVAANARDYPAGTGAMLLSTALAAFALGYAMNTSRSSRRR